jgi:glyceraldehyde-3-phosphate dehydrogenase/erythrose-4-phosphate dehydrogenase
MRSAIRRCTRICWSSTRCTGAGRRFSHDADSVTIDGTRLPFIGAKDPGALPLEGVDVVIDCTGVFKTEAKLAPYFEAGVKKVVVSRPGEGRTDREHRLRGQHGIYDPARHRIVTAAVLHDQLPRAGGEGDSREPRNSARLDHDDP